MDCINTAETLGTCTSQMRLHQCGTLASAAAAEALEVLLCSENNADRLARFCVWSGFLDNIVCKRNKVL